MAENLDVLLGDCRAILPTLEAGSVQTCVSSPPYWGLRDYGTNGQLGLEATPQEYIANMVAVFREVWRVLRDDGTLFLNLGDSYFSSSQREASYDTSGKEPASSQAHDYLSENLCGACRAADQSRKSRNGSRRDSKQSVSPSEPTHGHKELANGHAPTSRLSDRENHNGDANQHLWQTGALFAEQPRDVQESNRSGSYPQSPGACLQTSNLDGVFPLSELSSGQCVQEFCDRSDEFSQKQNYTEDNVSLSEERERHNRYIGAFCSKCGKEIQPQCSIRPFSHLLKPKDLCMMPARLAMALQADGWYLRSDIIWHKPNPMPESVTDRPTKAHEYIFLLTKNGGNPLIWRARDTGEWSYKPDLAETIIQRNWKFGDPDPKGHWSKGFRQGQYCDNSSFNNSDDSARVILEKRERPDEEISRWKGFDYFYDADAIREPLSEVSLEQIEYFKKNGARSDYLSKPLDASRRDTDSFLAKCGSGARGEAMINSCGRNKRTVWTIATQPYAEAHFATFPEEIPKLCILAGSKPGDIVLDPFAGSGTVGQVALELGRRAILIELNPAYIELARDRTFVTPGFF